jgi:hypothetical protein
MHAQKERNMSCDKDGEVRPHKIGGTRASAEMRENTRVDGAAREPV